MLNHRLISKGSLIILYIKDMHTEIWTIITAGYAFSLIGLRFWPNSSIPLFLIAFSWVIHTMGLSSFLLTPLPFLNFWAVCNLLLWMALPITYIVSRPLAASQRLLKPVVTMLLLATFAKPWLSQNPPWHLTSLSWLDKTHIVASLLAVVLLGVACMVAYVMRVRDELFKNNPALLLERETPPLDQIQRVFVCILALGFCALSVSISIGFLNLENILEQKQSHKLVFTFTSWLIYLTLLVGHSRYGWRGRRLLTGSIVAFICLIIGYLGSKAILELQQPVTTVHQSYSIQEGKVAS